MTFEQILNGRDLSKMCDQDVFELRIKCCRHGVTSTWGDINILRYELHLAQHMYDQGIRHLLSNEPDEPCELHQDCTCSPEDKQIARKEHHRLGEAIEDARNFFRESELDPDLLLNSERYEELFGVYDEKTHYRPAVGFALGMPGMDEYDDADDDDDDDFED